MVMRRYNLQTRKEYGRIDDYRVGTFEDVKWSYDQIKLDRDRDFEWIRVVEQIYNKHTETWVDSQVLFYREFK